MTTFFDTSALVTLLMDEAGSAEVADVWADAERPVASMLVYPEACAAVARAWRGRRLTDEEAEAEAAAWALDGLVARADLVPASRKLLWDAAYLAEDHFLRGYDAVHLASALTSGADVVVTGDHELAAAAADNGLRVVLTGEAA